MSTATVRCHDWHCREHDTFGWFGEECKFCPTNNGSEIDTLRAENAELREQLAAAQARIDELMFEYCPEEMTPKQIANYAAHQVPATPEEQAAIDAAIASREVE